METVERLGSVRRFGARYGRTVRHALAKIELEQRKATKCPYCNFNKVKKCSVGIWQCRKCNAKFTGRAYSFERKIAIKEEVPQAVEEEMLSPVEEISEEVQEA
jgi:large subunit ribosomal protein L37Ae